MLAPESQPGAEEDFLREVALIRTLEHRNIVSLVRLSCLSLCLSLLILILLHFALGIFNSALTFACFSCAKMRAGGRVHARAAADDGAGVDGRRSA